MRVFLPLVAVATALAVPAARAEEKPPTPPLGERATNDPRLGASPLNIPTWGVIFEGGNEGQRLTGQGVLNHGPFSFDLKLSGAAKSSTGRSLLFDALDAAPGGKIDVGITWSNFSVGEYNDVIDQIKRLCKEQTDRFEDAVKEDEEYAAATTHVERREAAQVDAKKAADEARAIAKTAQDEAEAARVDAEAREAAAQERTAALNGLRDARPAASPQALNDAVIAAQQAALVAQAAGSKAARLASRVALLELRATDARRREEVAAKELEEAKEAQKKERSRVEREVAGEQRTIDGEPLPRECTAGSELTPDRHAQLEWPLNPTYLLSLRGSLGTQSTDYFDTNSGKKDDETVHPWSVTAAAGVFIEPTVLVGASLGYKRARKATDPRQVCRDQAIGGSSATPPVYTCEQLVVGAPTWSQTSTLRGELRQYFTKGVAWNPSVSYTWTGPEVGLFAATKGAWQLDVPVFLQLGPGDKALVLGAAFTHSQTWGLGDKNENRDDLSVFLGGVFDIQAL